MQGKYSGIPIFLTYKGNGNWFEKIGSFKKSGVKKTMKQSQGKQLLVQKIESFEKLSIQEIGVSLSFHKCTQAIPPAMQIRWRICSFTRDALKDALDSLDSSLLAKNSDVKISDV